MTLTLEAEGTPIARLVVNVVRARAVLDSCSGDAALERPIPESSLVLSATSAHGLACVTKYVHQSGDDVVTVLAFEGPIGANPSFPKSQYIPAALRLLLQVRVDRPYESGLMAKSCVDRTERLFAIVSRAVGRCEVKGDISC